MRNPSAIVKVIFDGVLLLQHHPILPVKQATQVIQRQDVEWLADSFFELSKKLLLLDSDFLKKLGQFNEYDRDNINDETCELLEPYLRMKDYFNPTVAAFGSNAAAGLCKWVAAMVMYHEAAKIVKPKMNFLAIQEARLADALEAKAKAQADLDAAQKDLDELQATFNAQQDAKNALVEKATKTRNKMKAAKKLIDGLHDEKVRWTEDSNGFQSEKQQLVGDVAAATAFISYCGPFNQEYRSLLMKDYFMKDLKENEIPVSNSLELTKFLVDEAKVGEWNLQGLPKDDLSTQNAIMVTSSQRYPLMVDPQLQAVKWITMKEGANLKITNQNQQ